jgi:drug/metabolite transporter (DMT)-like permease
MTGGEIMAVTSLPTREATGTRVGISFALASAAAFGLSGPLAKSLLETGWSPAAVVAVRVGAAFLVLAIPCFLVLLRNGFPTRRQVGRLVVYGVVAVAGAQLCYYNAVQYLSVGVALLLEYLAPVLLIGWHWWRTKTPPTAPVLVGAGVAMAGMVGVLDLFSGLRLHPVGVLWGLGAALCLSGYFILSDEGDPNVTSSPLLMTTVGTGVGAGVLLLAGGIGLVPFAVASGEVALMGAQWPWWLPILLIALVCAVFAYLSGITAVRRLGSSLASFVSLTEVIFAVVFALILLGQRPSLAQLVGGALVLTGITVIQRRSRPMAGDPAP